MSCPSSQREGHAAPRNKGEKKKGAHRLDSLLRTTTDVNAKHALRAPAPLAREAIQSFQIAQRRLDRAPLEMDPLERRADHWRERGWGKRRRGQGQIWRGVVLGDEQGPQEGDELLVRDVWKRVVVDDRLVVRVAWGEKKTDRDEFSLSLNHLKNTWLRKHRSIASITRKQARPRHDSQKKQEALAISATYIPSQNAREVSTHQHEEPKQPEHRHFPIPCNT